MGGHRRRETWRCFRRASQCSNALICGLVTSLLFSRWPGRSRRPPARPQHPPIAHARARADRRRVQVVEEKVEPASPVSRGDPGRLPHAHAALCGVGQGGVRCREPHVHHRWRHRHHLRRAGCCSTPPRAARARDRVLGRLLEKQNMPASKWARHLRPLQRRSRRAAAS